MIINWHENEGEEKMFKKKDQKAKRMERKWTEDELKQRKATKKAQATWKILPTLHSGPKYPPMKMQNRMENMITINKSSVTMGPMWRREKTRAYLCKRRYSARRICRRFDIPDRSALQNGSKAKRFMHKCVQTKSRFKKEHSETKGARRGTHTCAVESVAIVARLTLKMQSTKGRQKPLLTD